MTQMLAEAGGYPNRSAGSEVSAEPLLASDQPAVALMQLSAVAVAASTKAASEQMMSHERCPVDRGSHQCPSVNHWTPTMRP